MLRHALRRAWASWMVKVAAFISWVPFVFGCGFWMLQFWFNNQMAQQGQAAGDMGEAGAQMVFATLQWTVWLLGFLVTIGAGASAVAEDLAHDAFAFYFSKPVTAPQYLLGRVGAVAIWLFALLAIPGIALITVIAGASPADIRLEQLGLLLPLLIHSLFVSVVLSFLSVGISAFSKSRALTMTAWITLFVIPGVLARIVEEVGDWPWLKLAAVPSLITSVGAALFKIPGESEIEWYFSVPILVVSSLAAIYFAAQRVTKAKVIQ